MTSPWADSTFAQALDAIAAKHGDREAVIHNEERLTYRELRERVRAFARGLQSLGLQRGDKIALWMPDRIEWLVARWSIPYFGAVLVPINTRFRDNDVGYVLKQSDCRALILQDRFKSHSYLDILARLVPDLGSQARGAWRTEAMPELTEVIVLGGNPAAGLRPFAEVEAAGRAGMGDGVLDAAAARVRPGDVAQILYTSGTTSFPKGAMVGHGALLGNNYWTVELMRFTERDKYLSSVPLFSATGTSYTLSLTLAGGALVLCDGFTPRSFCEIVEREKITVSFFVDTIVQDLKAFSERTQFDLSSLRTGTGAPLPTDSFLFLTHEMKVGELVGVYGMSETSNAVTRTSCQEPLELRSRTNGRPVPGQRLRIADIASNATLPPGQVGEICVAGYSIMKGYYKRPDEDALSFDKEGWFHTGDLGELLESGHLVYRGRVKEMIKPGGFNVATQEIEVFLKTFPGVREAVVVGAPDARLGEVGFAFVELHEGASVTGEQLQQYCRDHIASYKVPRYVKFVTDWPRTGSEKIRKLDLKVLAAERVGEARALKAG